MPRRHFFGRVRSHLVLIASMVFFTAVSWGLSRQIIKKYTVDEELLRMQRAAERIERENMRLRDLIEYTKTSRFVEREARLKKGLKAPDERVVVVRGIDDDVIPGPRIPNDERTNVQRWIDYLLFSVY